jgi:hypothetical protein
MSEPERVTEFMNSNGSDAFLPHFVVRSANLPPHPKCEIKYHPGGHAVYATPKLLDMGTDVFDPYSYAMITFHTWLPSPEFDSGIILPRLLY